MKIKFKKSYGFSFGSALMLTFFTTIMLIILMYFFYETIHVDFVVEFAILIFLSSFIIIQYRVERLIFKRIGRIFERIGNPNLSENNKEQGPSDMESLSREVQKFANERRQEVDVLNEREQYRREFLGNVSHELKTPLFTVQGYILTLLDGAIKNKEVRTKYLERAGKGVERLIYITKDLELIAGLESEELKLNYSIFDIVNLIQNVFDLLEMKAKKRNIHLHFDHSYEFPIWVNADQERMEQVLINLLVNAIKYGKQDGWVVVSIQTEGNKIKVSFKDNGEGIKPEALPRIFERFYRVDQSRSREQGGSGLGLSIVKHIMEAHHETVNAQSELGVGSTFTISLEKSN
ncbi:MAG: ATP-binding protein [Flavobacteriaceae bacterium]|nr:ATP-binding protein [Flavobacteriaceae bacterium]